MLTSIRRGMPEEREQDAAPEPSQFTAVVQIRRPREMLQAPVITHAHEVIMAATARKTNSYEEEQSKMATVTSSAPTPTTSAARVCKTCKVKPLSFNNTTGICSECQQFAGGRVRPKKVNGQGAVQPLARGLQLARRAEVAEPAAASAKPNGADHPDRDGNRAQPGENAEETTRVESRVDLLLAAIPREEKARMLCAWIAGTL
jgi:hypothetical protein